MHSVLTRMFKTHSLILWSTYTYNWQHPQSAGLIIKHTIFFCVFKWNMSPWTPCQLGKHANWIIKCLTCNTVYVSTICQYYLFWVWPCGGEAMAYIVITISYAGIYIWVCFGKCQHTRWLNMGVKSLCYDVNLCCLWLNPQGHNVQYKVHFCVFIHLIIYYICLYNKQKEC